MTDNEQWIMDTLRRHEEVLLRIDSKIDVFRETFAQHELSDTKQFAEIKTVWKTVSGLYVALLGLLEAVRWLWHGGGK